MHLRPAGSGQLLRAGGVRVEWRGGEGGARKSLVAANLADGRIDGFVKRRHARAGQRKARWVSALAPTRVRPRVLSRVLSRVR